MSNISLVPKEELVEYDRTDAEFYSQYFRNLGNFLSNVCGNKISDVARPSFERFDPTIVEKFNYIEISDINLSTGEVGYSEIPTSDTPDRAQFLLHGGEILVSTVRPNRSGIGLLPLDSNGFVASSGFLPLSVDNEELRSYLFVWFKFRAITDWLDRCSKASMYPAVSPIDILNTPLFFPPPQILETTFRLIRDMERILRDGRLLYPEAEQELLERMAWNVHDNHSRLTYIENINKIIASDRTDAEFYSPNSGFLREKLKSLNSLYIRQFCPLPTRGVQPVFVSNGGVWIIASKSIRPQGLLLDIDQQTTPEFYNSRLVRKAHINNGDVLLNSTGVGTLGRAAFYLENDPAIVDNHVSILKPNNSFCLPAYLSLFLNSPVGIAQSEMFQTGSSGQLEIYPQHINEILVYLPRNHDGSIDLEWQSRLSDKVIKAIESKHKTEEKLREAINLIELSIGWKSFMSGTNNIYLGMNEI